MLLARLRTQRGSNPRCRDGERRGGSLGYEHGIRRLGGRLLGNRRADRLGLTRVGRLLDRRWIRRGRSCVIARRRRARLGSWLRRRLGSWLRHGLWRGLRCRWWSRHRTRRKQRQRIHIAVGIGGHPYSEVDVRNLVLRCPTRADGAHRSSLTDDLALGDKDRSEMDECHGVPVARLDRHDLAVGSDGARKRDDPGRGRRDGGLVRGRDIDSAMLAAGVRIVSVHERPQDVTRSRPGPRLCRGGQKQKRKSTGQK